MSAYIHRSAIRLTFIFLVAILYSNVASAQATVVDLFITKVGTPATVVAGTNLIYTVSATNNGPDPAVDVQIVDAIPTGTTFVSLDDGGAQVCGQPAVGNTGNVDCIWTADTGLNVTRTLIITVKVDSDFADGGTISNTATVTSTTPDSNSGNNTVQEDTAVIRESRLVITKTADPSPSVGLGDPLTYTVNVENFGPSDADNVTVADVLPIGLISMGTTGCSEDPNGVPSCNLGTIAAGANAGFDISTSIPDGFDLGELVNTVTVTSDSTDTGDGVLSAEAAVQVVPVVPSEGTAVLVIDKIFIDGNNETPVTLRLLCDGASYSPESVEVIPDFPPSDYEQAFVVFNIPEGGVQECTVTEDPVPGYHSISICDPESMSNVGDLCLDPDDLPRDLFDAYEFEDTACQWTDIQEGDSNFCGILNIPEPVEVEITKVWDVVNMGGKNFSKGVDISFDCSEDFAILGPTYWDIRNNDYEEVDEYTAVATVTTHVVPQWFPAASGVTTECWAEEYNLASGVETESDCGDSQNPGMTLTVGGGDASCTISNTMFFEGIPTLNQYGMAIMALLMLGMGMLGFRRFA